MSKPVLFGLCFGEVNWSEVSQMSRVIHLKAIVAIVYNGDIIHYIYDILWLHDVTCARDGNPYSESLGYLLILKHCRWPFEISPSSGLRAVSRLSESWVGIWACLKIGYSEFPQLLSHIITIPDYPH